MWVWHFGFEIDALLLFIKQHVLMHISLCIREVSLKKMYMHSSARIELQFKCELKLPFQPVCFTVRPRRFYIPFWKKSISYSKFHICALHKQINFSRTDWVIFKPTFVSLQTLLLYFKQTSPIYKSNKLSSYT